MTQIERLGEAVDLKETPQPSRFPCLAILLTAAVLLLVTVLGVLA